MNTCYLLSYNLKGSYVLGWFHEYGPRDLNFTVNHFVLHNKQNRRKLLLNGFHFNGHALGFHPQIQKLELPCTAQ